MKFYYDTKPVYPYICIADINEQNLKNFISYIKTQGIIVTKFYEQPKYPASDGIKYDYLLRIGYKSQEKKVKPPYNDILNIFSSFQSIKNNNSNNQINQVLESEKKYFKQIRTFLDSERKIFELDRQFFKEQLENLRIITNNLKNEKTKIFDFIEVYNEKVNNEIREIIDNKAFNNEEIKLLERKLKEKEENLKKKEAELLKKDVELEKTKKENDKYRQNLEQEYQNLVRDLRKVSLGIEEQEEEDSIQDLRILIFGNSKVNADEIYEIFNEAFFKTFGEGLSKKCIEAKHLTYKSIKNSNVNKKIKQDKFDYIIVGQHDHSTKGKNSKHSYKKFVQDNNLKALVNEDYDNPLNKERLSELARNILKHWEEQFEIVE